MVGRKPKPSHLHLVAGNPGKRKRNRKEPKPKRCIPSPPDHLSRDARVAWGRFSTLLDRMGVLTEADAAALERLCEVYVEIVELQADIARGGRTQFVVTKSGDDMERQRPQVQMLQDADRRFRGWMAEFGLSPSSRTRVDRVGDEAQGDPADEFFKSRA